LFGVPADKAASLAARRFKTVRAIPITIRITLGQKVKKARIPNPTGLGLGSRVRPRLASKIVINSGPLPRTNDAKPIQKSREVRGFLRDVAAVWLIPS
jgi:hypothetical protein